MSKFLISGLMTLVLAWFPHASLAQDAGNAVELAREAIRLGENARAVNVLTRALEESPSADVYLYLGIAYGHMRDWRRAEEILRSGAERYPEDPRFHNEIAGVYLATRNVEGAKEALRRALAIDPLNDYASDLLAVIEMSEGNVRAALELWNLRSRPIVNDVMHNTFLTFGNWTVRDALAFSPGDMLTYSDWKTTELRLRETGLFSNASIEIEPTPAADEYNALIRTSDRTNSLRNMGFDLLRGAPLRMSYFNLWNIANSGVSLNTSYRWDPDRQRAEAQLRAPLPLPGLLFFEATGLWRSEEWDLEPVLAPGSELAGNERLHYGAAGGRVELRHIPHYRFEIGAGFEYLNRTSTGNAPELFIDGEDSGKFLLDAVVRLADGNRYWNSVRAEAFVARSRILGDLDFSGATLEIRNRLLLSEENHIYVDWAVKGGGSRDGLPLEEYFVLGVDTYAKNLLRGHRAYRGGIYGSAPMGTGFFLVNTDVEGRLRLLPLFNTFNIPYLEVKAEIFADAGKTYDRSHLFQSNRLYVDVGGGLKFQTPSQAVNFIYGRDLRDGGNVFAVYIEKLW